MDDNYSTGSFASDLALERRRADTGIRGVHFTRESAGAFIWERIRISSEDGAASIGRPIGNYDTLTLPRMDKLDDSELDDAANELAKELCIALTRLDVIPERLLAVGLGNASLTPDSIGPRAASRINATLHIRDYDKAFFRELECSEIAVVSPGVMAESGMEAGEMVMAICDRIMPDAVIAIDSLASASAKRLGTTLQISDTGIFPGSGIGNSRVPLSKRTLGVPVIAIGVPTVISAARLLEDTDRSRAEYEGLAEMFVSPREIDGITDAAAKVISRGINQAFGII